MQITKNSLATKKRVSENRKLKRPNCHKKKYKPKKRPKIQPKQLKGIGPACNPITVGSLLSITSIVHMSLVSTLNYDSFEVLDS